LTEQPNRQTKFLSYISNSAEAYIRSVATALDISWQKKLKKRRENT